MIYLPNDVPIFATILDIVAFSHVVSFIWKVLSPLCLVNSDLSFRLCPLSPAKTFLINLNVYYIPVAEALCTYTIMAFVKTFTWLLFCLWIFPFWASLVHRSAPEYYLSKWKCYCLNYDTTIIRWCISLFNFMWYMLWQKTHNMKSTLLAKFFSVQYSTVNCKHNVLHHISRTFSLYITKFLYLKKFCEENNVWVRMYEHNFGWVRFFNFFFLWKKVCYNIVWYCNWVYITNQYYICT